MLLKNHHLAAYKEAIVKKYYQIVAPKLIMKTALIIAFVFFITGCQSKMEEPKTTPLKLTISVDPTLYAGLIAIADQKDFDSEEGLEVTINYYSSGLEAMNAMIKGDAHIATVSDIAFALKMKDDPSLRIIASIGESTGSKIVARKDRNIHEPEDLAGKMIGYSPGTATEYHVHSFLITNRILRKNVNLIPIPPAKQAEAVINGEIDAVSAFDTYSFKAIKALGDNAVSWESQNKVSYQWLLVTKEGSIQTPAVKRLLKALIKAEDYALKNPDEAKSIISQKWKLDPEYVFYSWKNSRLTVTFNQAIITALQNYARWKMEMEGKKEVLPDIFSFLNFEALEDINPKLVTVYR
jgi:ABC-type nitrate/sulfonate/bicarbonate transport system substrate-binding protein